MSVSVDEVDKKLISILRSNSRLSVVNIAKQLNLSRATVQNRMSRLERTGIILNYSVNIKSGVDKEAVKAHISIEALLKREKPVIDALKGMPSVIAIHHTSGRWDFIAVVQTRSLAEFNNVLNDVRSIDGIKSTESNLLLDSMIF